jgi:uncharacterized protein (DUF2147 family)
MRMRATALQAAALAAALFTTGAVRASESPLGVWIDHTGRGAVEIKDCNGKLCGYVAWVKDPKDAEGCGEQIIGDVKPIGGGKWDNGWIYDPDRDSKFDVELTPRGETMEVLGYAGTKWLSETMTWKRAPADLQKCANGKAAAAGGTPAVTAAQTPAAKPDAKTATAAPKEAAKPDTDTKTAAVDPKSAEPKAAEPKSGDKDADKTLKPADDNEASASDDDEPDGKAGKKGGKAGAKIAEMLNLRSTDGGHTCKIDVPFLEAVVAFPCDEVGGK